MEKIVKNAILASLLIASAPFAAAVAQQAPAPQPLAKAAFVANIDKAFGNVDSNKDGFMDRAEIEAAETKAMAARKAQLLASREAAFKQLDKDNNGSLTLAEFNAMAQAQALPKADAAPVLARMDSNKDGKISAAEHRAPAVAQFDRADKNKDGSVSAAEQQAANGS
jgi:hypothetical protein